MLHAVGSKGYPIEKHQNVSCRKLGPPKILSTDAQKRTLWNVHEALSIPKCAFLPAALMLRILQAWLYKNSFLKRSLLVSGKELT